MSDEPRATDFEQLIHLFAQTKLNFVVIGGMAAIIHGSAYNTYDLDICYERTQQNVKLLCLVLSKINARLRDLPDELSVTLEPSDVMAGLNFTLETDLGMLDLLGEVQPIGTYPYVFQQSQVMSLYGHDVHVLTLEALIQAKRTAGRTKDLLILPELEALREMQSPPPSEPTSP
jgi:hypothetical protein